jgi:hypothetical protein
MGAGNVGWGDRTQATRTPAQVSPTYVQVILELTHCIAKDAQACLRFAYPAFRGHFPYRS